MKSMEILVLISEDGGFSRYGSVRVRELKGSWEALNEGRKKQDAV